MMLHLRHIHTVVIRGDQSPSSHSFTETGIKQCVILMAHLVTPPPKHFPPATSRHPVRFFLLCSHLLPSDVSPHLSSPLITSDITPVQHCTSCWFLLMFHSTCDIEAMGGLSFSSLSLSLSLLLSNHYQCSTSVTQPAFFHLTPHTQKQTNSYSNNSP